MSDLSHGYQTSHKYIDANLYITHLRQRIKEDRDELRHPQYDEEWWTDQIEEDIILAKSELKTFQRLVDEYGVDELPQVETKAIPPQELPRYEKTTHGRLIDAEKLKAHYAWWGDDEWRNTFDTIVDLQPTVVSATNE